MRYFTLLALLLGYFNSFGQLTVTISSDSICYPGNSYYFCTATATPSGGTPPYTYLWHQGIYTNGTTATTNCYSNGTYSVTVTDWNGTVVQDSITINLPPAFYSTATVVDDTCGLCIGSASISVSGGKPPYQFKWFEFTPFFTLVDTTPTRTGLCNGYHVFSVTDAKGCVDSNVAHVNFIPNCPATINGTVYNDVNANCNQDTLESGLGNIMLVATPGPFYATTNANGAYTIDLLFGNYTITQVLPPYYNEICPVSGSYSVTVDSLNHTITNINFADTITHVQDVSVLLSSGTPRPGFFYTYYLNYSSLNSVPMNGMVSLVVDTMLSYSSSSIAPDIISGDTLFWNYSNLQMFENRLITATFYVPADVNLLGDTLSACAQITPLIGDVNVTDNTTCHDRIITGAYDPNDKRVSPEGNILLSDNELKYTIRFQNTGSDTALNVVVIDTLSANLDVTSIRNIIASHPFDYSISGQGVLTFTFNNILLPDSNVNEPASHGLIQFTINQNSSNTVGTEIKNTAQIYFDFNPPIVTNTVLNTVSLLFSVNENVKDESGFAIYPNPTTDNVTLDFSLLSKNEVILEVFDIVGKRVSQLVNQNLSEGNHKVMWNVSQMNSGVYFVALNIEGQRFTQKIVIQ